MGTKMNITILNSDRDKNNTHIEQFLNEYSKKLISKGNEIEVFNLAQMRISYCVGCFDCWLKTPGYCRFRDDMENIYRQILKTNIFIFLTHLKMGFIDSLAKKMNDRLIPLLLPYIKLYKGEAHHYLRYGKLPAFGLIMQPEPDTDREDIEIVNHIYRRFSLNLQTKFAFSRLTTDPIEEIIDETGNI